LARLIFTNVLGRHARRHPLLREWLFRFEGSIVLVFWWLFRALPVDRAAGLGRWAIGLLGPRSAKANLVRANLSIAFPRLRTTALAQLAQQTWNNIGLVFGEYPHLREIASAAGRLEVIDHCNLERYRRGAHQAIFVSAHLSNWEVMALALAREGVPLLALYAPLQNPHLGALMGMARRQLGCELLARGNSMRQLIHHVREGGSVGLLLDLSVDDGISVSFFGKPMQVSPTPVRIALRYGCDVVPVRLQRSGPARFRFTAYPALEMNRAGGSDEGVAILATRKLCELMEQWIAEQPDEWMCANRRWDKDVYRSTGRQPVAQRGRRPSP
jgi:KDO2-lipid IV(A) lauroyltransferase